MSSFLNNLCVLLIIANQFFNILAKELPFENDRYLIEDKFDPELLVYRRQHRVPADDSQEIVYQIMNRQKQMKALDKIRFKRNELIGSDDESVDLESVVKNRQNQLKSNDRIRFRKNEYVGNEGKDLSKSEFESVLKLRDRIMKAMDGIRFRKRNLKE
jgi:hypothetical protein